MLVILEDDVSQHAAIRRVLEPLTGKNSSTGLETELVFYTEPQSLFATAAPDLFICDLHLPGSDGMEVLESARQAWPTTARILMSGLLSEQDLIAAINGDLAHRILKKPWVTEELRRSVAEGLAITRMLKDRLYWQELSLTDPLTHLWNRRGFLQQMIRESSRSRRNQGSFTLLMLDMDDFKKINDEQGHIKGDEVLRKLARVLNESVRAIDWVCRYGGDEFAILLTETAPQNALEVAERLRIRVQQELGLNMSLGLAGFPLHGQDPGQVIESADRALYTAKTRGRKQTCVAENPSST